MTPVHVGIIMDGNRRWAKQQGLPTFEGHRQGFERIKEMASHIFKKGIKILTIFVFSTENWKRTKEEVSFLLNFLKHALTHDVDVFIKEGIRIQVIGDKTNVTADILDVLESAEQKTKNGTKGILNVAFNYGGRRELVQAFQGMMKKNIPAENITEETISSHIYTAGQPDPDLIIRTSGEQRLSGFLLWQASYAELFFSPKYWPAFEVSDFDAIVEDYEKRQRRFGV